MGLKLTQRVFAQSFGTGMATARIQALFLQRSGGDECDAGKEGLWGGGVME